MASVGIFKKYSFIEYLGPNIELNNLGNEALSNIDKIFGISDDNDHLIEFAPDNTYNQLNFFETNKKYLVIANSDRPNFTLYTYS